jgi:hypothetical protein
MTEAAWLACTDPEEMLSSLRGTASDRKLRLFAAACRRIWDWFADSGRRAIEVAERYADGLAELEEVMTVRRETCDQWLEEFSSNSIDNAAYCLFSNQVDSFFELARATADCVREACRNAASVSQAVSLGYFSSSRPFPLTNRDAETCKNAAQAAYQVEHIAQCRLLRDIFHGPCSPVFIRRIWFRWNTGTINKLAQTIYDERRFGDLPILADALEEAGCDNPDVLAHCRQPGEHVRGCWVVDALLGKS